jgi:hypothetical protein
MVPENKQNTFIGLHNNLHPSQHTVGNVHKASRNCQQRPLYELLAELLSCVLRSIPKEAFADSVEKLYECCQQCVVKDGDYFEDQ